MHHETYPFPHQRLDAYTVGLEVARDAKRLSDQVPRGYRSFADQMMRAAGSTVLLIAEGANRRTAGQKRQRFSEARGECGEVAAAAEMLGLLGLVPGAEAAELQGKAARVAAMLTGLLKRIG